MWDVIKKESNLKKSYHERCVESSLFNEYFVNLVSNLDISKNTNVPDNRALELVNNFTSDIK